MSEQSSRQSSDRTSAEGEQTPRDISFLIDDLSHKDGDVRKKARKVLVEIKPRSVSFLIEALSNSKEIVRWEAAKALEEIADSSASQALVNRLLDKDFDVRWLAAEGLLSIGRPALTALLHGLILHSDSSWMRQCAHYVIRKLLHKGLREQLKPVLDALDGVEPTLTVPVAAMKALEALGEV